MKYDGIVFRRFDSSAMIFYKDDGHYKYIMTGEKINW